MDQRRSNEENARLTSILMEGQGYVRGKRVVAKMSGAWGASCLGAMVTAMVTNLPTQAPGLSSETKCNTPADLISAG
jgi:hypothetical protein